jgi:hypothetical protein
MGAKRLTAREVYEAGERRISEHIRGFAAKPKIGTREGTAAINRELIRTLRACCAARFPPTKELIDRIARQLGVSSKPKKHPAYRKAMDLLSRNGKLSSRKVAEECKVTVATVSKWREGIAPEEEIRRDFEEESRRASKLSDLVNDLSAK